MTFARPASHDYRFWSNDLLSTLANHIIATIALSLLQQNFKHIRKRRCLLCNVLVTTIQPCEIVCRKSVFNVRPICASLTFCTFLFSYVRRLYLTSYIFIEEKTPPRTIQLLLYWCKCIIVGGMTTISYGPHIKNKEKGFYMKLKYFTWTYNVHLIYAV